MITQAAKTPKANNPKRASVKPLTCLSMCTTEMMMRPKKNDQIGMGCATSNQEISLAKVKILVRMPANRLSKNPPLICSKAPLIPCDLITPQSEGLIRLTLSSRVSRIPVIKAIVPPETPGTTSAAPMAIPLK